MPRHWFMSNWLLCWCYKGSTFKSPPFREEEEENECYLSAKCENTNDSKPDTCAVMPFVLCDGWTHCIKWATCKQAHSHCSKLHTAGEQDNTHGKKHRPSLNMTFSITRQTTFTMVYRKWIDRGPNIGLGHIIKTEKHNKSCCFFQTVICDGSFPIKITIEYCCMCDLALV